jgi:hypothetical protein
MLCSLLLALAQSEELDALMRRSLELRTFSAVFELTATESETTRLRIDYERPARVRVERSVNAQPVSTMWFVDGALAVRANEAGKHTFGRADPAQVLVELEPIELALHEAFPNAAARAMRAGAAGMKWDFNPQSQTVDISIEVELNEPGPTPLGWLTTLKKKALRARTDGELLRFEKEPHFALAISKRNGFLQEFRGTGPKGSMRLDLVSLELDQDLDPARFALPNPDAAFHDISAELERVILRGAQLELRHRIYAAAAGDEPSASWSAAEGTQITALLRLFHDVAVPKTLAAWLEKSQEIEDGVRQRLARLRELGKSAQEIEQTRQRELGYLNQQLDKFEQGFLSRLSIPESAAELPRAAQLLELEKAALSACFEAQVRAPTVASFLQATGG